MNEATNTHVEIEVASVTDRGLSEKRPVNEDSFLADAERRIFAVADGVGGAQAGEVASRTAVEVLDEAFSHHKSGEDVEDLMEIAIQRANASIHQMTQAQAGLSMMATTFVGLHLDSHRGTIGHVGDSRLYRLTPDGMLHRETADHSVVEEEVRAGRMTEAQALHHPNRNIISRALGAEAGVEADMKTIEVTSGTIFLLCSDGITRHVPDEELQTLLSDAAQGGKLQDVCDELKRRCYERGAEDNLTAVIVRVGKNLRAMPTTRLDDDITIASPPVSLNATLPGNATRGNNSAASPKSSSATDTAPLDKTDSGGKPFRAEINPTIEASKKPPRRSFIGTLARLFSVLLLIAIASVGAFFFGRQYERRQVQANASITEDSLPSPTVPPVLPTPNTETVFQQRLHDVDLAPREAAERMRIEKNNRPLETDDPQFLYLYGRALMNSGNMDEAKQSFRQTLTRLKERHAAQPASPLNNEVVASIERDLSSNDSSAMQNVSKALEELVQREQNSPSTPKSPSGASTILMQL